MLADPAEPRAFIVFSSPQVACSFKHLGSLQIHYNTGFLHSPYVVLCNEHPTLINIFPRHPVESTVDAAWVSVVCLGRKYHSPSSFRRHKGVPNILSLSERKLLAVTRKLVFITQYEITSPTRTNIGQKEITISNGRVEQGMNYSTAS